ncbi:MAG: hypothetical protein KDD36_04375 [Flavobacteriales bacterium]|nr:hypothetical protein [Flavobacteriales bacterium]
MPTDKELFQSRNKAISEQYNKLSSQGYSNDYILAQLSQTYFLKERTIYAVVSGEYDRRKRHRNNSR